MERAFGLLHRRVYERERWSAPSGCCTVVCMKEKMERAFGLLHRRVYERESFWPACINEVHDYTGTADTPYCTRGVVWQ